MYLSEIQTISQLKIIFSHEDFFFFRRASRGSEGGGGAPLPLLNRVGRPARFRMGRGDPGGGLVSELFAEV